MNYSTERLLELFASSDSAESLERLLDNNPPPYRTQSGRSLSLIAAVSGSPRVMKILASRGLVDEGSLNFLLRLGHITIERDSKRLWCIKYLVESLPDLNFFLDDPDKQFRSVLYKIAANIRYLDSDDPDAPTLKNIFATAVRRGADPDSPSVEKLNLLIDEVMEEEERNIEQFGLDYYRASGRIQRDQVFERRETARMLLQSYQSGRYSGLTPQYVQDLLNMLRIPEVPEVPAAASSRARSRSRSPVRTVARSRSPSPGSAVAASSGSSGSSGKPLSEEPIIRKVLVLREHRGGYAFEYFDAYDNSKSTDVTNPLEDDFGTPFVLELMRADETVHTYSPDEFLFDPIDAEFDKGDLPVLRAKAKTAARTIVRRR